MNGDISRASFDPHHHFTRVLAQQGRVSTDADWNEQVAVARHHLHTVVADLLGPHAGPADDCGFGLLSDPAVVAALTDDLGRPLPAQRVEELSAKLAGGDFLVGQGRYYVHGMLAECDSWTTYSEQAGYPFDDRTTVEALRGHGAVLVYLEVWERHVSAVERPELLDVALGGADTTTRAELVWQVRISVGDQPSACGDVAALVRDRHPLLRARARPVVAASDPTASPSGYSGAENRLYRVEIHRGGQAAPVGQGPAGATFTWSRDNGSTSFAVVAYSVLDGRVVVQLRSAGHDLHTALAPGDLVELVDDASTMRGVRAPLLPVESIDGDIVALAGAAGHDAGSRPELHPLLRRWDHGASGDDLADGALIVREATLADDLWIDLEDGVSVQFPAAPEAAAHDYRAGDHWLVPARTATGDLIWPSETLDGQLTARPRLPDGTTHHLAPLAVASCAADGAWTLDSDCRRRFGPT